jgi:hypothetical protein
MREFLLGGILAFVKSGHGSVPAVWIEGLGMGIGSAMPEINGSLSPARSRHHIVSSARMG